MKLVFTPPYISSLLSDGQGQSYDLSPLAMDSRNWEVEPSTDDTKKTFYINVCRSLVQMDGQSTCLCPSDRCMFERKIPAEPVLALHDRFVEVSLQRGVLYEGRG